MTITVLERDEDAVERPLPWRRMIWVTWRQHRVALAGVATFLIALGVYIWHAGLDLHHAYGAAAACHHANTLACGELTGRFDNAQKFLANGVILQTLPALIGAFLGGPIVAREMETGTFRFAWTQGIGRWRWTLAKLVLVALAVVSAAGLISALFSWYYQPYFAPGNLSRSLSSASSLAPQLFDLRGVAFAAWTLVAFAIGVCSGALIRRVVPAIVTTLVVYAGLAVAAGTYLQARYLPVLVTEKLNVPSTAWIVSQWWTTRGGKPVSASVLSRVLQHASPQLAGKGGVPKDPSAWSYLVDHGFTQWTTYQPASRFWPFQWIEGGWLFALSILLCAVTLWVVRRRAA